MNLCCMTIYVAIVSWFAFLRKVWCPLVLRLAWNHPSFPHVLSFWSGVPWPGTCSYCCPDIFSSEQLCSFQCRYFLGSSRICFLWVIPTKWHFINILAGIHCSGTYADFLSVSSLHFIWHVFWLCNILFRHSVCHLILSIDSYLTSDLIFYLSFYLTSILTHILTCSLTRYLTFSLPFYLTFLVYLMLTFYLA